MLGPDIRLPWETSGLPPMQMKNSVRSMSGIGNIQGSPSMLWSATFCGNWSIVPAEKERWVPRALNSAGR